MHNFDYSVWIDKKTKKEVITKANKSLKKTSNYLDTINRESIGITSVVKFPDNIAEGKKFYPKEK